ncbi:AAA family ATPase [Pseudomonas sp. KBW05]|uniref:AAA family ATPase n=1 Tax=Pseudomonas sp. KBW05 TaxID=2153360 RepID=UPI000F5AF0D6|nr:AAA family ATPase [Pseudomonas sp. KBW05]RQO47651.1 chromosome segregation protein SMC [Pseudomonas sp. KBW05]
MKILAIRLKNLASLAGPFEIDFTAEPLASAGLFAITGPTGAGKSTLLDALCLALFGAVPRLGDTGQAKMPDADSDISIGDPRTLLRRGTGGGYAEVDFVGVNGRRYRARWEANRARDKASGKLQNSRQSLIDLDSDQLLASQKTEYKTQLELALGLNFEQFTRAVLLAQSEFSAFLKANDNERSELLEKLTDTALYTQLGRRAFDKAKEAKDAHKQLQDQATGVVPLAAEVRAELDQQFDAAQQQLKTQQAQLKQLEAQQAWLKELREWQERQLSATEQLQRAQADWASQGQQRQDLSRLDQLAPQRHHFARQAELGNLLSPLAAQIQHHIEQQATLNARQEQAQQQQTAAQGALVGAVSNQSEAAPLLQQAFAEQTTLAHLTKEVGKYIDEKQLKENACIEGQSALGNVQAMHQQASVRIEQLDAELAHSIALAPLSAAWDGYRPSLQQLMQTASRFNKGSAELPQLEKRATTAAEDLAQQRQALDLLYQEAGAEPHAVAEQIHLLAGLLQDNRKQQHAFEDLKRLWDSQQQLDHQSTVLAQKLVDAHQQREILIHSGKQAKAELTTAEHTLTVTKQLLERQRAARSESVEELRATLEDDHPCPVCGSHEHPYHQPEALLQSLGRHDESEEATAQKAVDTLNQTLIELRGDLGGVNAQIKEYLSQQEELIKAQTTSTLNLQAHALGASLLDQDATKRSAWVIQQLSQLTQRITQDEQRQSALLGLQQNAGRMQQQLETVQEANRQTSQMLADQQRELSADSKRLDEAFNTFASLLPTEILEGLRSEPTATFMQLDQQVSQRLEQMRLQQDELSEQQQRQQAIEKETDRQQNRQQQLEDAQRNLAGLTAQQQAAQEKLSALLGDHTSAEHWQQQLDQAVTQSRQSEADANKQLHELHNALIQLAADLNAQQERQQALQTEQHTLVSRIGEWRALHPELDDAGLARLLAFDDAQVSALRQQLQHSEKAVEQAKVLLQEREQRLADHQALHNGNLDAEQLDSALAELNQQVTDAEKHLAELRARQSEDQRRQDANHAFAAQIAKAYEEWQRWARLNALIGSATGDTFRKIAQAYNLDLLVHHANVQLRQLVRRYRLKRGGSMLGLLVQDTEMGDELRSVHSLSGGETFLVSLALALGLASMASSTLKIESLFIDEGFGSLDPESLQLAMDALDGLQAQGRKVAVISHVQEMHERIPVQIQVKRQGNGLSTLEVK